jgi:hypothetical protein
MPATAIRKVRTGLDVLGNTYCASDRFRCIEPFANHKGRQMLDNVVSLLLQGLSEVVLC